MDPDVLVTAGQRALLVVPAFSVFLGIGWIRWDARRDRPPSPRLDGALTATMWGLVALDVGAIILRVRLVESAIALIGAIAVLIHDPIVGRLVGPPDPRWTAGHAIRRIVDQAASPFPPDRDRIRRELAELDDVVTPETFEFVQLARASIGHWLDGGSQSAPIAVRWRERMSEIARSWWPPAGSRPADPGSILGRRARAGWLPLGLAGGAILGASIWTGVGPIQALAAVSVAWLLTFTTFPRGLTAVILGFVGGLVVATLVVGATCATCAGPERSAGVAVVAAIGLGFAGAAALGSRGPGVRRLRVLASDADPGEPPRPA